MKNLFVRLPALVVMLLMSGTATAEEAAISASTLDSMGLSGITIMSDDAGLAIRGHGYPNRVKRRPVKQAKPWVIVYGYSYASIGGNYKGNGGGHAYTEDGFVAHGNYYASGEHYSEAGRTTRRTKSTQVKGKPDAVVKKRSGDSVKVFAGGWATASAI